MVEEGQDLKVAEGNEKQVVVEPSIQSNRLRKKSLKMKEYTTLPAFLIEVLRQHGTSMSVTELIPIVVANISTLRKSDGRKYTCTKTRVVVESALHSILAFRKTREGWALDEQAAQIYKKQTLRNINYRLGKVAIQRFDAHKACSLLLRRAEIEGNELLLHLAKHCATHCSAQLSNWLGTELMRISTSEAMLHTFGPKRAAGMCVMYHLMRTSRAMTDDALLPDEDKLRRKLSNLSLSTLCLENKLRNEIEAMLEQQ